MGKQPKWANQMLRGTGQRLRGTESVGESGDKGCRDSGRVGR